MNKVGVRSGKVKFFKADRGFGFITTPEFVDIFFHVNNCQSDPKHFVKNADVEFEIMSGRKGNEAKNVMAV